MSSGDNLETLIKKRVVENKKFSEEVFWKSYLKV
jgi:hypothetical protein